MKNTDIITPTVTAGLKGTKADIIICDEVMEPAKMSYLKSDFISAVAVLAASDAEWKLEDVLPYAEEICQKAGERYNEMLVAEQERELQKAIEKEEKLRYVRVEYMDGDVQYWATDIKQDQMSNIQFGDHAKHQARKLRPFMEIRYTTTMTSLMQDEANKPVRDLETSEIV